MNQECCVLGGLPHPFLVQVLKGIVGPSRMVSGLVCSRTRKK